MWTPASTDPKLRADLLNRVVDIAVALSALLEEVGTTHFVQSSQDCGEDVQSMFSLEEKAHRGLQSVNERRNDVLSPTARLPDDILRSIFCLLPFEEQSVPLMRGWGTNSIAVSHVCRRWRALALDTAAMWSQIVLHPPLQRYRGNTWHPHFHDHGQTQDHYLTSFLTFTMGSTEESADKAYTFLSRSKASALSLDARLLGKRSLGAYMETGCGGHGTLSNLQYLSRTTDLRVQTDSSESLNMFLLSLPAASSSLKTLHLQFSAPPSIPPLQIMAIDSALNTFFGTSMPSLEDVVLGCIPLPLRFTALHACKCLSLHLQGGADPSTDRFQLLASSCLQLQELEVTLHGNSSPSTAGERVVMSSLETLAVRSGADFIFNALKAPSLSLLELQYTSMAFQDDASTYSDSVGDFLRTSSTNLASLIISDISFAATKRILESCPSIAKLAYRPLMLAFMTHPTEADDVLQLIKSMTLTGTETNEPLLCPSLQDLSLSYNATPRLLRDIHGCVNSRKTSESSAVKSLRRIALQSWVREGMATSPEEAYKDEAKLAAELDEFVVGKWIFDIPSGRWTKDRRTPAHTSELGMVASLETMWM